MDWTKTGGRKMGLPPAEVSNHEAPCVRLISGLIVFVIGHSSRVRCCIFYGARLLGPFIIDKLSVQTVNKKNRRKNPGSNVLAE